MVWTRAEAVSRTSSERSFRNRNEELILDYSRAINFKPRKHKEEEERARRKARQQGEAARRRNGTASSTASRRGGRRRETNINPSQVAPWPPPAQHPPRENRPGVASTEQRQVGSEGGGADRPAEMKARRCPKSPSGTFPGWTPSSASRPGEWGGSHVKLMLEEHTGSDEKHYCIPTTLRRPEHGSP